MRYRIGFMVVKFLGAATAIVVLAGLLLTIQVVKRPVPESHDELPIIPMAVGGSSAHYVDQVTVATPFGTYSLAKTYQDCMKPGTGIHWFSGRFGQVDAWCRFDAGRVSIFTAFPNSGKGPVCIDGSPEIEWHKWSAGHGYGTCGIPSGNYVLGFDGQHPRWSRRDDHNAYDLDTTGTTCSLSIP